MSDIQLRVAAKGVIINEKGEVLILREASSYEEGTNVGRWQIPGGRINPGEHFEDGLKREVREETGLDVVEVLFPIYHGEWRPTIKDVPTQIIALYMVCRTKATDTKLSEEHDEARWIQPQSVTQYDMVAPEDKVILRLFEWQNRGVLDLPKL